MCDEQEMPPCEDGTHIHHFREYQWSVMYPNTPSAVEARLCYRCGLLDRMVIKSLREVVEDKHR